MHACFMWVACIYTIICKLKSKVSSEHEKKRVSRASNGTPLNCPFDSSKHKNYYFLINRKMKTKQTFKERIQMKNKRKNKLINE